MKLTTKQLKQIIREEIENLSEMPKAPPSLGGGSVRMAKSMPRKLPPGASDEFIDAIAAMFNAPVALVKKIANALTDPSGAEGAVSDRELNEMQTHLGLPHVFSGFDLAGRLYDLADGADPSQPNEDGEQIRQMSLNRLVKLRHQLSEEPQGSSEAEHLIQEIDMLEDALDHYDTAMEDWNTRMSYQGNIDRDNPQHYPVDKTGQTRMLNRRHQQQRSRLNKSYHKTYTKDKGW